MCYLYLLRNENQNTCLAHCREVKESLDNLQNNDSPARRFLSDSDAVNYKMEISAFYLLSL